jgi:hypothetical protein
MIVTELAVRKAAVMAALRPDWMHVPEDEREPMDEMP